MHPKIGLKVCRKCMGNYAVDTKLELLKIVTKAYYLII